MLPEREDVDWVPDVLPIFPPEKGTRFTVEFSHSMALDLSYCVSLTGLPLQTLTEHFTRLALGSDRLAEDPEQGVYRQVGGFDELVSLDHPEYSKDLDWMIEEEEDDGCMYGMDIELPGDWADTLMEKANERGWDLAELYRRMFRVGIGFIRDIEDYSGHYFIKRDGCNKEFGYALFYPEDGDDQLSP